MKPLILALFLGVASSFPDLGNRDYPSCSILDFTKDEGSGALHATYRCKVKEDEFKCSDISLDNCVAVRDSDGSLFVRG
ncbi:hypothetical protein IMZ48_10125 [Candidatus Bathyarchaeota archaeon]|nr:hypothetical protein [Candidatus Bathyarchaeota archaeon]